MALDLTTAQAHLDAWLAADLAVSQGRAISMEGESLSRESADRIREQVEFWESKVAQIKAQASAGSDDFARNQPGVRVARWTR